jgi:hypothetical protein
LIIFSEIPIQKGSFGEIKPSLIFPNCPEFLDCYRHMLLMIRCPSPAPKNPDRSASAPLLLTPQHSTTSLLLTPPHSSSLLLTPPHSSSLLLTPPHSSSLLLTPPHSSSLLLTPPHSSSLLRSSSAAPPPLLRRTSIPPPPFLRPKIPAHLRPSSAQKRGWNGLYITTMESLVFRLLITSDA